MSSASQAFSAGAPYRQWTSASLAVQCTRRVNFHRPPRRKVGRHEPGNGQRRDARPTVRPISQGRAAEPTTTAITWCGRAQGHADADFLCAPLRRVENGEQAGVQPDGGCQRQDRLPRTQAAVERCATHGDPTWPGGTHLPGEASKQFRNTPPQAISRTFWMAPIMRWNSARSRTSCFRPAAVTV